MNGKMGSACGFHSLTLCSCGECGKGDVKGKGKAYKTSPYPEWMPGSSYPGPIYMEARLSSELPSLECPGNTISVTSHLHADIPSWSASESPPAAIRDTAHTRYQ